MLNASQLKVTLHVARAACCAYHTVRHSVHTVHAVNRVVLRQLSTLHRTLCRLCSK
jgi:hypothetical protein